MQRGGTREQQLQVIVELGHRADRGARGAHRVGLVDGDGRRNAVDAIHRRLVHAIEELARVGREGLDVATLAFGVQRVEHQRGLARARHARHHHQLMQRNVEVEILQVVLPRAVHADAGIRCTCARAFAGATLAGLRERRACPCSERNSESRIGYCTDRVKGRRPESSDTRINEAGEFMVEKAGGIDPAHRRVIFASSLGTVFEWYDFYLYGSLVAIITKKFFSGMNDTTAFLFALLAFAAGFFVRPFGALVFGRLGDMVGRKYTFLLTIVIMGASTALVGCPADVRDDRHHGAHPLHRAAAAAGPRARWSVRRGGDLHFGTRPGGQARPLHELDPDHGDAGLLPLAARHPRVPLRDGPRAVRCLGLARAVPALDGAAPDLRVHPSAIAGIA